MLDDILNANIFAYFLIFTRIGGNLMVVPALGEVVISTRVRLYLALALTLALFPLLNAGLPTMPESMLALLALVLTEFVIGVFIGASARLVMTTLQVAGTVISFQSSLAFARTVDPTARNQGAVVVSLFSMLGVVLIFITGLHYMLLKALVDSYVLFPPGIMPPVADFADTAVRLISKSFLLGMQIAAPFIAYGIVFYTCLGLLGRLMPKVQLFFIVIPIQILFAFSILMILLAPIMLWFLEHFEASIAEFLVKG